MKTLLICIMLFFTARTILPGQPGQDSIFYKKGLMGYRYYLNDKPMNMPKLLSTMQNDEDAFEMMNSAQAYNVFAAVLTATSTIFLGVGLGSIARTGEANWKLTGIGAGLVLASVPFHMTCAQKTREAVLMYNDGLHAGSLNRRPDLNLAFTGTGFMLSLRF